MLKDVELREAHEALQNLPPAMTGASNLKTHLDELTSVTMLLLRSLDVMRERYTAELRELKTVLKDNADLIQRALDLIERK